MVGRWADQKVDWSVLLTAALKVEWTAVPSDLRLAAQMADMTADSMVVMTAYDLADQLASQTAAWSADWWVFATVVRLADELVGDLDGSKVSASVSPTAETLVV